jgi:hypothetical protein
LAAVQPDHASRAGAGGRVAESSADHGDRGIDGQSGASRHVASPNQLACRHHLRAAGNDCVLLVCIADDRHAKSWAELRLGLLVALLAPVRRLIDGIIRIGLLQVAFAGAVVSFLSGMFLLTSPLRIPVFFSYGLPGCIFSDTEALD